MRRKFGMEPKSTAVEGLGAYAKCAAALAFKKSGMMSKDERKMVSTFTLDPDNLGKIIDIPAHLRREIVQL